MTAEQIIELLGLGPHPEGGYYRETYRHAPAAGGRGDLSHIYFLLTRDRPSPWHRLDAVESWHHYLGDPLLLRFLSAGEPVQEVLLGADLPAGQRPYAVVPAGAWQMARTLGGYTLVGCAVAPAFELAGFEMAPDGFDPAGYLTPARRPD